MLIWHLLTVAVYLLRIAAISALWTHPIHHAAIGHVERYLLLRGRPRWR